ncbi:MAG: ParA family protein [Polyangiaceae bacterium]|nr:ParA family protein [Polyangiaceae bacterium]
MSGKPVVAFFSTQRRIGQTTLIYHLACLLAELGHRILVVDLDPQADLSAQFEPLHVAGPYGKPEEMPPSSALFGESSPLGCDFRHSAEPGVAVLSSHANLLLEEAQLSRTWASSDLDAPAQLSLCWRNLRALQERQGRPFDLILLDVAHYPGAISRAALLAADSIILLAQPTVQSRNHLRLALDILRGWQQEWQSKKDRGIGPRPADIAPGHYRVSGYLVTQGPGVAAWPEPFLLPGELAETHAQGPGEPGPVVLHDLGIVRHFGELHALSREAHKPMFALKAADGAVGSHARSVIRARETYEALASRLLERLGMGEAAS